MLQPRESRLLWRRRKRRHGTECLSCSKIYSILIAIGCLTIIPQGLTQYNDDVYIVKPTPALRLNKEELTTVLLVTNENHGRYINVRPEVGLLTSTARTFIQEGVTTEYATQVVGTKLDNGRVYAQYLKKSSRVLYDSGTGVPPSVVTSWVGESLHSDAGYLPQSHNDLFDADQPDWQAIDDRLLGNHRNRDDFIGNTDYVGLRKKSSSNFKGVEEVNTLLKTSSSHDYMSESKPAYNIVAQQELLEDNNAQKVAANKVLPIGDLPTYTVKQIYEPSAYLVSNHEIEIEQGKDSSDTISRNPKFIYKQLMQNSFKNENGSHSSLPYPRPVTPVSRHFATVTYYGFADFTTVVGDSIIVFSPSTSANNLKYNAHVTSIKGEATLDADVPEGPSVVKVPITIAQDIIDPTITYQPSIETVLETAVSTIEVKAKEVDLISSSATTGVVNNKNTKTEPSLLEMSEDVVPFMKSEISNVQPPTIVPSVTLSRPSDEEILRIYNALANANAKVDTDSSKTELKTTTVENSTTFLNPPISRSEIDTETSNIPTYGATTIFFEDDPFANFMVPSKTSSIQEYTAISNINSQFANGGSILTKQSLPSENSKIESFTISKSVEITTEQSQLVENTDEDKFIETTTDESLTTSERDFHTDFNNATTSTEPVTKHSLQNVNSSSNILPNILVKEIDPDNDRVPVDCVSTSQVFLTQLPKTITVFDTMVITDASITSELKTEIRQKVQPTFEIKEATKYYCIQASTISSDQMENPLAISKVSAIEEEEELDSTTYKAEQQSDVEDITKINNKKDIQKLSISNSTDENELEVKAERSDMYEENGEGITEHTDNKLNDDVYDHVNDHYNEEDEASGQLEDGEEDDEEIELIYKTLYTTYTYLTTFFHADSTSISSHTEVVTNVMTSTLGISLTQGSPVNNFIANLDDNEISPTGTLETIQMESTKRFIVPSEVESFIRTDEDIQYKSELSSSILDDSIATGEVSEALATFYTTYTYYTTIFADEETDIMSHTEVITNIKKATSSVVTESDNIIPTISHTIAQQPTPEDVDPSVAIESHNENVINYNRSSSLPLSESSLTSNKMAELPNIPDLGNLSAITLVTDVRSSSSLGDKQIINNIEAKMFNDKVPQQHQPIFEDQISSESNTDTDEIIPSATLLLQTSFTTFTYYTTMYSGDKTNVISRLETMTNIVTETLQSSRTIDLEGASVPITYFTTFTYWTKLARAGQIITLSREETISNVIVPTVIQQGTQTQIENLHSEAKMPIEKSSPLETFMTDEITLPLSKAENKISLDQTSTAETSTNMSTLWQKYKTNILEPTTYYTTYTYYTTSYEIDKTQIDSRFETVTNIVTPTVTLTKDVNDTLESPTVSSPLTPSMANTNIDQATPDLVLYDFKKIIDADGISTIFFTTEIKPTINSDGLSTEVISSSSSLLIDENKRSMQATALKDSSTAITGPDGQTQKQYKTGLVRLIEGTRIANRTTTLYQSKVIGTIIDQRYAQIIESTSSFIFEKTKNTADATIENSLISPTSLSNIESIPATEQVFIPITTFSKEKDIILESSLDIDQAIDTTTKEEVDADEEINSKPDEKLRFPLQTKKPPFISPHKAFSNRNRPQFAPKKNSSATIITRSDFTPTITATPALKTISRFQSSRRTSTLGISSTNSGLFVTSSRRFGRPIKSSSIGSGAQISSSLGAQGASRNRFASSSNARGSFGTSTRRLGASLPTLKPSFSRTSLFSSGLPGNSRLRSRPTTTADLGEASITVDISTSIPNSSQEEGRSQAPNETDDEEENITESNRRQNNPLLRLRRPLNRPQGFTPARAQPNSSNNAVTLRKNPLTSRPRNGNIATSTTTTTAKPKTRTFQPPFVTQNRFRSSSSLFPSRNIFGVQKPTVTTEENRDLSEEDTNENNDDSEYEDDDDEESDGDDDEETSRRRRSNIKTKEIEKQKTRKKREAHSSEQNRSNFRNRFRRPKFASSKQTESRTYEDEGNETKETISTDMPQSTSTQRTRSRFGTRYSSSSLAITTATSPATTTSNHKAIRPTRPTINNSGRAQFTLREKDSPVMTTTQKGLNSVKRPAFRRPQLGGNTSSRRIPTTTAPPSLTSGKRRLKSYTNNDSTTTSRNSVTGRIRPSSPTSGRSRSSGISRDNNVGARNRARNNHNYNNNEALLFNDSGTIIVTHVIPAEVTIPVINGKVTEYKQVVTAKTSTEVVGPQQYTTIIASNGVSQLALTREDSSVNYNGATEVTKYILHETPTTTVTFTPTTIRGRKTSFSHVLPSTVYSVEQVVSTVQPQISANAPLANILLSQLLLGNVGLPAANPLLGALGGALTQPGVGLGTAVGPAQPATPVTEYKTHASIYVTTVYEGQSTILPVTFQGKKILTTIFDTTAQTITATEFVTDTIVTTPAVISQPQPVVNSLLLQQLLLQQHLQQQQQFQKSTPDSTHLLNGILNSVPPQSLLGGDSLQELEASNNIRGSGHGDILNEEDDFGIGSSVDLDDIALQAQSQTHKNGRKKTRKSGKNHKRKSSNGAESHHTVNSSVITLYVSGRRPGEFSTVLSTVQLKPDSTQYKRHAHTIDSLTDFLNDGQDAKDNEEMNIHQNEVATSATQPLESIVGDVSIWYALQATSTKTKTLKTSRPTTNIQNHISSYDIVEESPGLNSVASEEIHKQFQHFDSGQEAAKDDEAFFQHDTSAAHTKDINYGNSNSTTNENNPSDDIDEARYNLATRIMSNGVEVIIASDKSKTTDHMVPDIANNQLHYNNKPMTLAASTIKNQMILLLPSLSLATDNNYVVEQSLQQLNNNLSFHTNHFITKTCLTTYTYRTTYIQDGRTTVESREKVISNIATEGRHYPKITPTHAIGVTLTKTPELAVGIFSTTYSYFNTFKDNSDKMQVISSDYTVINTITGTNDYVAYLKPTANATPALQTNTYYNEIIVSQKINSNIHTVKRNLTQVVVTKSYPPAHSTSVLTSYYAYDGDSLKDTDTDLTLLMTSITPNEEKNAAEQLSEYKTKTVGDIYIYATKTFLSTLTYYTATVLNSYLSDGSSTELRVKPLSTVFNYYTRVIQNVISDSVPATLLPSELVTKMKIQLSKQIVNDRRPLVVTTATLKDGQTVKISAVEMPLTMSSEQTLPVLLQNSQEDTKNHYLNQENNDANDGFRLEQLTSLSVNSPPEESVKGPANHEGQVQQEEEEEEENENENNGFASLASEQVITLVNPPNAQQISNTNTPLVINDKPSTSAANQLIQRLTALKPMFNAMADLLQHNFGSTRETINPIKSIESKQAPNKKISSSATNTTINTKHPIYIPVQKSPVKNSPYEISNFTEFTPQSLHIKPPLLANLENNFETSGKNKIMKAKHTSIIPLATFTEPRHEQPLHNGGIYIRPGDVITANSDVIVGKPNGIEYVQIPNQLQVDKNTSTDQSLDNRQFQVTYYHNKVQHPYSSIAQQSQHIPTVNYGKTTNKLSARETFGLRPPSETHFNKNILKPPPPPPPSSSTIQSSIPIRSQQGLSLMVTATDKPVRNRIKQEISTNLQLSEESTSHLHLHSIPLQLPSSMSKTPEYLPAPAPIDKETQNFYNFNNELKNNEILEIQPISQIFSADLKPNSMQSSKLPKLSNINRRPTMLSSIYSAHANPNIETNYETNPNSLNFLNSREQSTTAAYIKLQPQTHIEHVEEYATSSEYLPKFDASSNWKVSPIEPQMQTLTPLSYIYPDKDINFGALNKNSNLETNLTESSLMWKMQNGRQPKPQPQPQIGPQFSSHIIEENSIPLQNFKNSELPSTNLHKRPTASKSSTNLPNMDIFLKSLSTTSNYYPSSNHVPNKENENLKQNIKYTESVTKNHQNVSLDQHIFSHTIDVNVPPLTFNREDHDYPQQAATAVRGQIPPVTVKKLRTQAENAYKYMPLITIPAHEQQVHVKLTPLNSIAALTLPQEAHIHPPWKAETADTADSNIVRKISLPNTNFKVVPKDQGHKTFATNNILNNKPKSEPTSNWKHYRRQHMPGYNRLNNNAYMSATIKPIGTAIDQFEEHQSKRGQHHFRFTLKPNQQHHETKMSTGDSYVLTRTTTMQPLTQVLDDFKFSPTRTSQSQSVPHKVSTVASHPSFANPNQSVWLVSEDHRGKIEHGDIFNSTFHQTQLRTQPLKEKNRATRVSTQKTNQFGYKLNKTIASQITSKSHMNTTITNEPKPEDINEIMNSNNKGEESMKVTRIVMHGEPFRKSSYNRENFTAVNQTSNQTKTASIFVVPGESFKMETNKTSENLGVAALEPEQQFPKKTPLTKEVVVSRESQYSVQYTKNTFAETPTKTSTSPTIASQPLKISTKSSIPKTYIITTETVLGLEVPPVTTQTNLNSTSKKVFTNHPLPNNNNNSNEVKRTRLPYNGNQLALHNTNDDMTREQMKSANTKIGNRKQNEIKSGEKLNSQNATIELVNTNEIVKSENNSSPDLLIHLGNESRKSNESLKLSNLQPSESYDGKILTTKTSPLAASVLIFTTTTTTTIKRIILPTKYITNKHVYTVTTTASDHQALPSTVHLQTTSYLSTTETSTTTEVTTLFLTHTKINTIVDTVTSVKTLRPITITATTTLKPSSTEAIPIELSSVKAYGPNMNIQFSLSSTESNTPEANQDLAYLPYPSVEVVSTNISKDADIRPNENSIFIIMTNNNKNKNNNIFAHHAASQLNRIPPQPSADSNFEQKDENNEVMIEYDNGISFDDIPIRDEESGQIVNAFVHNVASVKDSSPDDPVLFGGVLIATPPKSPVKQLILNDSSKVGCHPKCRVSRNEQCGLVDNHWSCFCRPGFARMFPDRPCKPTYTYDLLMHAERVGNYPLQYVSELSDNKTEHYKQLSQLVNNALDRMIMQSDFRDAYHGVDVSQYTNDHNHGIFINVLLQLSHNSNEKRLEEVFKKELRLSNYSIGGTDLYTNKAGVDALSIKDFNECMSRKLHDCSENAHCFNLPGTYTCSCIEGFADVSDNPIYPGRTCSSEEIGCEMCHYHGKCSILVANSNDLNYCECFPWYAGSKCQVNLKILLIVLLGIGTLLFILLLFCILITCTNRRNHIHQTTLAPSTVTSSSEGLQKNSQLAANMLISSVSLRSSLRGVRLKGNRRQKPADKRSMMKDSSSETSQNSFPCALKNRESITDRYDKKKNYLLKRSKSHRNCGSQSSAMEQFSISIPANIEIASQSGLNNVLTKSTLFKENGEQIEQQNLLGNATDYEGHYCEQSDRSLTVMIPRAKYHSSVLPQTQLMHHQLTMERVCKTTLPENTKSINADKDTELKRYYKNNLSATREISDKARHADIPSNPGALISAGFEVSAIVRDKAIMPNSGEQHSDLVHFDSIAENYNILSASDPATSLDSNSDQKHPLNQEEESYTSNKNFFSNQSDYSAYKCEKDLIESMDEWLENVKLNELSAEVRSFDETTIRASTKPLHVSTEGSQTQEDCRNSSNSRYWV